MNSPIKILLVPALVLAFGLPAPATQTIQVDLSSNPGEFRTAWGANIGPIPAGQPTNPPVTSGYRDIGVKFIRTHDYYGPLDMKMMYPDQAADPAQPSSYDFTASDHVWRAIVTNGFWPYFRLGNSYTNAGPYAPTNQTNWIDAAVQVIKHYTDTTLWGTNALRYVEIWNEPDHPHFWEQDPGSRLGFFAFFTAVANRLRAEFPNLKIGGPGVTPAAFLTPSGTNYIGQFLDYLRSNGVTLDFLSYHVYSNDPNDYIRAARFYRANLDARGFNVTELHVTEYNTDTRSDNDVAVRAWMPGAAINTTAWMAMQQEGIALATIYRGPDPDIKAPFFYGIFYADAQPKAVALACKLCTAMAAYTNRLSVTVDSTNLWVMAGRSGNGVAVLISNPTADSPSWKLSLSGGREPQEPKLVDIVATSTNAARRTVIYWALRTNSLSAASHTIEPWGVQLIAFSVLSDYDHWAQTVHKLSGPDALAGADPDGDGFSNESEFVAGTNPADALSRLRIDAITALSGNITLQWDAVAGKTYCLQNTTTLWPAPLWSDVSPSLTNGFFIHSNVSSPEQIYRVRVDVP